MDESEGHAPFHDLSRPPTLRSLRAASGSGIRPQYRRRTEPSLGRLWGWVLCPLLLVGYGLAAFVSAVGMFGAGMGGSGDEATDLFGLSMLLFLVSAPAAVIAALPARLPGTVRIVFGGFAVAATVVALVAVVIAALLEPAN